MFKDVDKKLWKNLQDTFGSVLNLPVYTIDDKGEEHILSNDFPYFCKIIKSKKKGAELCRKCRVEQSNILKTKEDKILMYTCHAGLTNIMVPVNKQKGAVICGAIVQNIRDITSCRNTAKEISVDTEELVDALDQMKIHNVQDVKTYATLMFVLSKTIPQLSFEKAETDKKISELTVLNKIAAMVNSTLELDKILKSIMSFMLQSVTASTCSILILETKKRYGWTDPTPAISHIEAQIAADVVLTKSTVKLHNIKNDSRFENLELDFNPVISFPLKIKDEVIGMINLFGDTINMDQHSIDLLIIIANQVAMAVSNAKQYEVIKKSAITDKLTELYNRRHFMDLLAKEVERSARSKSPLSVVLFDIDDFKHYNDTWGHPAGDTLLTELSNVVKQKVRAIDTVGRYGGEEFIIVCPQTKSTEARAVAERVRKAIEVHFFEGEEKQPTGMVTVSLGLTTCMNGSMTSKELIKEADRNLYKSKLAGKNRVSSTIIIDKGINPIEVIEE